MPSTTLDVFRKLLRRAIFINHAEGELFDRIPDAVFEGIFQHNFQGNLRLAERILLNRHKEVDRVDRVRLEQYKQGIHNLGKASDRIVRSLKAGEPVLFVTDADNDGSLAQSILMEFSKTLPADMARLVQVEYAQPLSHTHGLTREIVDLAFENRNWSHDEKVLVVTADNGINNQVDVENIMVGYPQVDIIITDHHLPREDLVVKETARAMIVNPKYKPTEYFRKNNISGANTLGVLLRQVNRSLVEDSNVDMEDDLANRTAINNIDELGLWGNLLDYANASIADMPIRPYIVEKALELRPLLNVSNSMRNLVVGKFEDQDFEDIALASQNSASDRGVSTDWLKERVDSIKLLNEVAHKLLNLYHDYGRMNEDLPRGKAEFYQALSEEMASTRAGYDSINPNYIEQLRPIIFNLSAIDNKDIFLAMLNETMVKVFEDLRGVEREILEELRGAGLLKQEKLANSTILYPVDKSVTKVFNRKLLSKAYNEDNNGFLLILNDVTDMEARGSMRSLYPITKLLEDKSEIEDQLNISVNFQGHEQAAGFFINSTDGKPLSERRMTEFNQWMDDRVAEMKLAERINSIPNIEVDFASVGLVEKINRAIKANLAGMWGIPAVMSFSPDKRHGVWITDNETSRQINLDALLDTKKYGYQAIKTDFHDGAVVAPVELLRAVADSNFEKSLRLSYMDEGVFMASQVVDKAQMPNLVDLKGGRADQQDLMEYYQKTFRDSNFVAVSRDEIKASPYFRFNRYGQGEFEFFEALVIEMLDISGSDVLAVIDTEGTGLGKAPKCFNIGGTHLSIDADSGTRMGVSEFEDRYFRNDTGNEFLLSPEQMTRLERLGEGEASPEGALILHNISLDHGVAYQERFVFDGKVDELERVTNVKRIDDRVVYNRRLRGEGFAFLIKDGDFAITQELENLTGISNWMIDEAGKTAAEVDEALDRHFRGLKGPDGKPAKIIFQAHNMPYDRGVSLANFRKLNKLMDEHMTSDTAKIARAAKLAYDDTPVATFMTKEIPNVAFYDSPFSDYSMTTFLQRAAQGKSGVFPDTKAKVLLRYNGDTGQFSIIDRAKNHEVMIMADLPALLELKESGQASSAGLKYSVERLSSRAMIRNIMLLGKDAPKRVELLDNEEPYRAALELFQDKYHFDATPEVNIENFANSLWSGGKDQELLGKVNLGDLVRRFLIENRDIQARFHDGWIYEKVLSIYEPDGSTLRVPAEVIEEINYFTDLPSSKIRQVLDDVVLFKRHFGIQHALVHEQHNNIRQTSEDGQGLADTVYEAVLPQFLAMMKFFNPYYHSVRPAAEQLVWTNVRGSMIQSMMADDFTNDIASDSFSMTQMLAFQREEKTGLINKAEALAAAGLGSSGLADIKFRLGADILPPNTCIYATPRRHVEREQIMKDAEMLAFIVVNEQAKKGGEGLAKIAEANDEKAIEYRNDLMTRYERVSFSRRDVRLKKLQEVVRDAYEGNFKGLPKSIEVDQDLYDTGQAMINGIWNIYQRTGMQEEPVAAEMLRESLKDAYDRWQQGQEKPAKEREEEVVDEAQVRTPDFLPDLEIRRQQPMRFALEQMGVKFCATFMREVAGGNTIDADEEEEVPAFSGRAPAP